MARLRPHTALANSFSSISERPDSSRSSLAVLKSRRNAAMVSSNSGGKPQNQVLVTKALLLAAIRENGRGCKIQCSSDTAEDTEEEELEYLGELRVPQAWVEPEVAAREAEWLRVALHQWLDDEFCPEPANEEISKRCSKVYYCCLLEQQLDIGDILIQMVRGLETFSFKASFHGAFSSANAAIDLITKRMRSLPLEENDSTESVSETASGI
ncbi:hypothetical protein R1flu_019480 [Riccia fluitans]|uniref:Uncharacterized protein n=1 Tax=Riccia fluitans TaxID=41844 RepID=A0ABD1ZJU2_9MARC